jgi:hypothetical protein
MLRYTYFYGSCLSSQAPFGNVYFPVERNSHDPLSSPGAAGRPSYDLKADPTHGFSNRFTLAFSALVAVGSGFSRIWQSVTAFRSRAPRLQALGFPKAQSPVILCGENRQCVIT